MSDLPANWRIHGIKKDWETASKKLRDCDNELQAEQNLLKSLQKNAPLWNPTAVKIQSLRRERDGLAKKEKEAKAKLDAVEAEMRK
jgi:hypothetical protein